MDEDYQAREPKKKLARYASTIHVEMPKGQRYLQAVFDSPRLLRRALTHLRAGARSLKNGYVYISSDSRVQ